MWARTCALLTGRHFFPLATAHSADPVTGHEAWGCFGHSSRWVGGPEPTARRPCPGGTSLGRNAGRRCRALVLHPVTILCLLSPEDFWMPVVSKFSMTMSSCSHEYETLTWAVDLSHERGSALVRDRHTPLQATAALGNPSSPFSPFLHHVSLTKLP